MKIEKNTVVSVTYHLHASDGQSEKKFVEKTDGGNPLTFLFGSGNLIQAFEENLQGLGLGDKFQFDIPSGEAYGPVDQDSFVALPLETFKVDGNIDHELLTLGNMVPMMDENGNRIQGKVVEVKENEVLMDFNHMLAGKDLHFSGEVIEVRPATEEEISHGHVHGPNGHHHH
jgi:FKBP-type peptidyl-prolyl cis-trans isomerase SlyD